MIKNIIFSILKLLSLMIVISGLILIYLVFYYTKNLPNYEQLAKYHPSLATRIYTIDGKLIEQYARENRVFAPLKSLPKYLVNAFIAAEDKHFYSHPGIDLYGIIRAAISNVLNILQHKRLQGASTITQQVVKNLLLSNERSVERKIKEAVLSYMISKTFSKDQILELYLNQAFLGKGSYGVGAASQVYFNKSPSELTIAEAAFIAGLPKAPSNFDPTRNYARSKERRDYVINRMLEDGYITKDEADGALNTAIVLKKRFQEDLVGAGHAAELVRKIVSDILGEEEFYTGGYVVITTLESKAQIELTEAFTEGIRNYDQKRGFRKAVAKISIDKWQENLASVKDQVNMKGYELAVILKLTDNEATIGLKSGQEDIIPLKEAKWARSSLKSLKSFLNIGDVVAVEKLAQGYYGLRQIPIVNGGMVLADPRTGCVKAHVGGYDFSANKFDRVTQAIRQPGSTIKPFVYLAALEKGIAPNTIFDDTPASFSQGKNMPMWTPKNYKGDFLGPITMRQALEKSRNLVTVRVATKVGIKSVSEILERFGISPYPKPYLSMVLGAVDTTLSKMVNAYSMLANGGYQVMPHYVELIQDRNGKIIYRRDDAKCNNCENYDSSDTRLPEVIVTPRKRIVDERVAYQMNSILKGAAVRGTSGRISKYKLPIASKTGTTNESFDAWTIAYTKSMIVGGYVGYDQPATLGKSESGATVMLPIIDIYLAKVINKIDKSDFVKPAGIEIVRVNPNTGAISDEPGSIEEAIAPGIEVATFDTIEAGMDDELDKDVIILNEDDTKEDDIMFEDTGEVY
ncbi:MAG: penicillin-binding protein 1A [Rickettsiaceae bacterium]|nr:penicillin-binding protein 1A [Rickettsiaceae bacterium]